MELAKYDQILTTIDYPSYNRGFLVLETRTNLPTSVSLSLKHILCHNKVMTFHRLGWDGIVDAIFVTIFLFFSNIIFQREYSHPSLAKMMNESSKYEEQHLVWTFHLIRIRRIVQSRNRVR